jgi:prephenate dehydrogenase
MPSSPYYDALHPEPLFKHVAVIGLGLIGGSLAKLIHRELPASQLFAFDIDNNTLQRALDDSVIQHTLMGLNDPQFKHIDLVILATHPKQSLQDLETLSDHWPHLKVMDLGSAKQSICTHAEALAAPIQFIGGHPLAGKEVSGFEASDAALFFKKRFLLTPCRKTPPEFTKAMLTWLQQLQFETRVVSPEAHDTWMALVSHFPQAYALILARILDQSGHDWPEPPLAFAGGGLHDHIRLMGSSEAMWQDVFHHNADALDTVLEQVIQEITAFRTAIKTQQVLSPWFNASAPIYEAYYHKR